MKAIMMSLALFGALSLTGCASMYKGGCGSCQQKCECKKECCKDGCKCKDGKCVEECNDGSCEMKK